MDDKSRVLAPLSVTLALMILSGVLLFVSFIPLNKRLIILMIAVAITMVFLIITRKPFWRYMITVVLLLMSLFLGLSQVYVNKMAEPKTFEVVEYTIYRLKDHDLENAKNVGFYGVKNEHKEDLVEQLRKSYEWENYRVFNTVDSLLTAFNANEIDVVVINKATLGNISIEAPKFEDETIMINTLKLEIKRDSIVKPVDVLREPFTLYLSGIDVYGDVVTRSRSDMNILVSVDPVSHEVLTVSVPRDSYVSLGCEKGEMDKLTHAGLYGVSCSVKTLEKLFNIDVNYYIRLNFTGLVQLIDALDGVDVYAHEAFETESDLVIHEGVNHLSGEEALVFARERDNVTHGDVSRGFNHQALVKAIFNKIILPENIMKYPHLSPIIQDVIDTNLDDSSLSKLIATQLKNEDTWLFREDYLSGVGDMQPTYSQEAPYKYYVYWPDEVSVQSIQTQINDIMTLSKGEK